MEKPTLEIAEGKYKLRACVNWDSIKDMIEEELKLNYEPISLGKSATFLSTGNISKSGNYIVLFKKI